MEKEAGRGPSLSLRPQYSVYGALLWQAARRGGHRPFDREDGLAALDNATSASFVSTLKRGLVHRRRLPTREAARSAVFEHLEAFYNRRRLHSSLGYVSPESY